MCDASGQPCKKTLSSLFLFLCFYIVINNCDGLQPSNGPTQIAMALRVCAMPQDNLAVTLMALQRYDEAEPILREAVEGCGHRTSDGRKSGGRGVACSAKGGGGGI